MPTGRQVTPPETTKAAAAVKRQRVLSGMRPTGKLHIGNYFGALPNWLKLQADNSNDCYFFVADWHSLTSDYADTSQIAQNSIEIATDFLASGLNPNKSTIFQQSQVPEHAELHLLLSMVTPLGWLERVPTYKEALENIKDKDLHTYGFLGYPVLQTADIVMYGEPNLPLVVPVGEDQVAHVELGREIVRAFDRAFGRFEISDTLAKDPGLRSEIRYKLTSQGVYFPPPPGNVAPQKMTADFLLPEFLEMCHSAVRQWGYENFLQKLGSHSQHFRIEQPPLREPRAMLTQTPRIPGTDGRKMSKSYGNTITLGESDAEIRTKTKVMVTDPARKRRSDPGNPDVCPVYDWHKLFAPPTEDGRETLRWAAEGCRTAAIGCIECKAKMADNLIEWIRPVRERRKEYESKPGEVLEVLDAGSKKAREVAKTTMARVREAVFGWDKLRTGLSPGREASQAGMPRRRIVQE